ncbi:unnamed protein product [Triticum turgidum subsp. durum]|uniref:Uncharacterized protein n=1 Tax=Triticum turgidum subsp. durum TaxID=4567 RepID=A0A9R1QBY4_TRITD|nr:unnamed protein product [Triticum turgidum subsp. durum]
MSIGLLLGRKHTSNKQVVEAEVVLQDDQVVGASWQMQQVYNYGASNNGYYLRNVSSVGYDVLFDHMWHRAPGRDDVDACRLAPAYVGCASRWPG